MPSTVESTCAPMDWNSVSGLAAPPRRRWMATRKRSFFSTTIFDNGIIRRAPRRRTSITWMPMVRSASGVSASRLPTRGEFSPMSRWYKGEVRLSISSAPVMDERAGISLGPKTVR